MPERRRTLQRSADGKKNSKFEKKHQKSVFCGRRRSSCAAGVLSGRLLAGFLLGFLIGARHLAFVRVIRAAAAGGGRRPRRGAPRLLLGGPSHPDGSTLHLAAVQLQRQLHRVARLDGGGTRAGESPGERVSERRSGGGALTSKRT